MPSFIRTALTACGLTCGMAFVAVAQDVAIQLPPHWKPLSIEREKPIPANLAGVSRAIDLDRAADRYEGTGKGIRIAVVSSGIQMSSKLAEKVMKLREQERLSLSGLVNLEDEHGSGTFFSGVLTSEGVTRGVSPGVQILPIPIVSGQGVWKIEDLATALKFLVERKPGEQDGVSIVCLTLSDQGSYQKISDAVARYGRRVSDIREQIVALQKNNVLVLAPTGEHKDSGTTEAVAFPAIIPEVIRIGAFWDTNNATVKFENSEFRGTAGQRVPFTQWSSDTIAGPAGPSISTGNRTEQSIMMPAATLSATAVAAGVCALVQSNHLRVRRELPSVENVRLWLKHSSLEDDEIPNAGDNPKATSVVRLNALLTLRAMERDLNGKPIANSPPKPTGGSLSKDMREVINFIGVNRIRELPLIVNGEKLKRFIDGTGQCVAIVSTGINSAHADFRNRIAESITLVGGTPEDEMGVGTFVAGIISANGTHVGIAPGARIVSIKAFSRNGATTYASLLQAMKWLAKESPRLGITAVLLDGGGPKVKSVQEAIRTDIDRELVEQIRLLRIQGIPVIVPAGNASDGDPVGMSFPAILPEVISVAAFQTRNLRIKDDPTQQDPDSEQVFEIAPYSLRLTRNKVGVGTTIVAPGGPIVSSGIADNEGSATMTGTSMAAAVTTGAILLLQDYHKLSEKTLPSVDHLMECLRDGAWNLEDPASDSGLYLNRLDAFNALRICQRKNRAVGTKDAQPLPR